MQEPSTESLLREVQTELRELESEATATARAFNPARAVPAFRQSGVKLMQYLALRRRDLRPLQKRLAPLGLSSLGRLEAHVAPSFAAVLAVVDMLLGERHELPSQAAAPRLDDALRLIEEHATPLFGPPPAPRSVRIMVTLPPLAAEDPPLVPKARGGRYGRRADQLHSRRSRGLAADGRERAPRRRRDAPTGQDLQGPRRPEIRTVVRGKELRLHVGDRLVLAHPWRLVLTTARKGERRALDARCQRPCASSGKVKPSPSTTATAAVLCARSCRSEIEVEIISARTKGAKLTSDKGINLPDVRLELPAFTADDREDLRTVVEARGHRLPLVCPRPEDVRSLREALRQLGHPELGAVANRDANGLRRASRHPHRADGGTERGADDRARQSGRGARL